MILADDLTPTRTETFSLLANRRAEWAEWDDDLSRLEIGELKLDDLGLALTGFDADQLLEIMADEETTTVGNTDDAVADVPETAVSRPADVWIQELAPTKCTRQCACGATIWADHLCRKRAQLPQASMT